MKLVTNRHFKAIKSEDIKSLDDVAIFIENASPIYRKLLKQHYNYQKRCEDGIWEEVFAGAKFIAAEDEIDCNEKTVHRFNADMGAVIFRRRRFKDGKQTSNVYKMNKTFYQFMKAFWRLGLWKEGTNFEIQWRWIKKLWVEVGCDTLAFMNKVWNYKSLKSKDMQDSCEHRVSKMSVGKNDKCPSISNSLSLTLEKYCTGSVPAKKLKEIEARIANGLRLALDDLRWYTGTAGKTVRNHAGFVADALSRRLRPRKV